MRNVDTNNKYLILRYTIIYKFSWNDVSTKINKILKTNYLQIQCMILNFRLSDSGMKLLHLFLEVLIYFGFQFANSVLESTLEIFHAFPVHLPCVRNCDLHIFCILPSQASTNFLISEC